MEEYINWITEVASFLFGVFMSLAVIAIIELRKQDKKQKSLDTRIPSLDMTGIFQQGFYRPFDSIQEFAEEIPNFRQPPDVGFCFFVRHEKDHNKADYVMIEFIEQNNDGTYTIIVKKIES